VSAVLTLLTIRIKIYQWNNKNTQYKQYKIQ